MVAVDIFLTTFLCLLQSQVTPSNGFTLPFSSFSSQVLPRRPTNSSVNEVKNLPSVSTSGPNLKSPIRSNCRPPDNELSSSRSRGSVISPLSIPTAKDWSSTGSNPQHLTDVSTPGVIRQQVPVIQPTLSNSLSSSNSYSVPTLPYITNTVASNVISSGTGNSVVNIPEFVTFIPKVSLNALKVAPNAATQSILEPNIPLPTVTTAFTLVDGNLKSELSSKFQGTASPLSSFANTGSSLSSCTQSVNINVGSGQPSETNLAQHIPSVLPMTNPISYSLPVVPNTNVNDFSATPRLNTFHSLPDTQQRCLEQTSNMIKLPSFNMLSRNTVPLSNNIPFSPNLVQENNAMRYNAVSSQDSNNLALKPGFSSSSSIMESNHMKLDDKSDYALKIKPKSIDLKILPIPPSPTEKPLQGCVRPLLRNSNKTSLYSPSTKRTTVDESNLLITPSMTPLNLPALKPLSNVQKPPSCIKSVSPSTLFSQPTTTNQVSSELALDKSIPSIAPISGLPNLQPYSYMSSSFLPQNLLKSYQEVTLSPQSYKYTSETQSRDAANLQSIPIIPVLPKFCSESIAPVPSSTQCSSSFPSLLTFSLIPSSTVCLNNISTTITNSITPSDIKDKISCCLFPIYSSDKILPSETNKPNIGQAASLSLPSSSTQSISNNYQTNKLLHPTVTLPSSQASNILQTSVDSHCMSLNAPKIPPSSQNFLLSNDQSILTPPQVPIKTGQILAQNHLIPTLAYPNKLPIIKQCKEPSICGDTFSINPKISKQLDQSLVKNTLASASIFPSSTSAYKPLETYPYAHPIPPPVIIDTSPDRSPSMPLWLTLLAQKIRASKSNTFSPYAPIAMPSFNCSGISAHTPLNLKCPTSPISYCPSPDACSTFPLNNNLSLNSPDVNTLSLPTCGNGCAVCIDIPCSSVLPPKPLGDLASYNKDCYIKNSAVSFNEQSLKTYSSNFDKIPNLHATWNCLPINHVNPKSDKAFTLNPFDLLCPPATNSNMSPVNCLSPVVTPSAVPIRCPDLEPQDLRNVCSSFACPKIVNNAENSYKCQPSIYVLPDTPGFTIPSTANDKLKFDLLAPRCQSSNLNSPPITPQPLLRQVHSPDDFKSKISFQSPLSDLRDFSIVSSCPTAPTPVLPPIKCPDIFLPLDDISLLLQKPFKKILPALNFPELCPLKPDFDEFQINKFSTVNIPITPTVPILNLSPKSPTDTFSEYLKTFCINALETSSIPATVLSNSIESPNLCFNDATSTSYITNKFKGCPVSVASKPNPKLKCCDYCISNLPAVPPVSIPKDEIPKTPICRDSIHQIVDIPIPYYLQIEDQICSTTPRLVNNKNIKLNTMYPSSEMFIPVAALPAVSCDFLDIPPVFDSPISFKPTSGVPLSSSLPEVILCSSCLPSSSLMLPPTLTSQNCFDDTFSLSMLAAPSSIDLNSNIILDQQYMHPKSNFETSSTLPIFLLDYLSVPSSTHDSGFPTLDNNEYVIVEEVLPPRVDSSFLPFTSDYQTNVMNTMYPSECFYEVTNLPIVSCDLFDAENSILPNSMFSTYPEYLIPSTVFLANTPSAYNAPVIELLSASDPSTFVSNDMSQIQSKSSFIINLTKKLAKALITSAVPNLAALCTKD